MYTRKLPSGVWQVTAKHGGQTRTATASTRSAAIQKGAELLVDLGGRPAGLADQITVAVVLADHATANAERWSPQYAADFARITARLPAEFLEQRASNVTASDVAALYARLSRTGTSPHRLQRLHGFLSGAFRRAAVHGWVRTNPATGVTPTPPAAADLVVPTAEQVAALVAAAPPGPQRLFMRLAAITGARRGELVGLQWDDVDDTRCEVTIRRARSLDGAGRPFTSVGKTGRRGHRVLAVDPATVAMLIVERAGSDNSAIRTRAVLDEKTNEWILNGEKIFVTGGDKSFTEYEKLGKGFIVVWASIDPAAGRAGLRAFVVEGGTPGVKVVKLEHKLGIRCSDTAAISLVDARVPFENILGSPTVETNTAGFKKAMATFDATRPLVAATGVGVARAALEFLKEKLAENGVQIRYGMPRQKLTSIERDVIDMEIQLKSAWLMVIKAVWMADNKKPNALESSMSKVKAGDVTTKITQKVVEILGPLGYSREFLAEKWFRDAKITDIYEGTGQINRLVVARNILGYSGSELR